MQFSLRSWSAWAPGITTPHAWQTWAEAPTLPLSEGIPEVNDIPAMQRRRMNRLSKMAYVVAQGIEYSAQIPQIFCSRHGDLARTIELLQQLAQNEPLSSMHFALSVHNAVGGGVSILQGNHSPISSISAGKNRIGAAILEALNHLVEYDHVVLIVYDELMPDMYQALERSTEGPYAYALLIAHGNDYNVQWQDNDTTDAINHSVLPPDLQFLAFLLTDKKQLNYTVNGVQWQWSKSSSII